MLEHLRVGYDHGANRAGMDGPAFRRHVARTGTEGALASADIASTLRQADGGVTILDDKVDVENDAIFVWLKGHSILRGDLRHSALVTEPGFPQPWQATAVQFTDVAQATTFLQSLHAEAKRKPVFERWFETRQHEPA